MNCSTLGIPEIFGTWASYLPMRDQAVVLPVSRAFHALMSKHPPLCREKIERELPLRLPSFSYRKIPEEAYYAYYQSLRLGKRLLFSTEVLDLKIETRAVATNRLGSRIATGSDDSVVRIWEQKEQEQWKVVATLEGHTGFVESVAMNDEGTRIASASLDSTTIIWQRKGEKSWEMMATLNHHSSVVDVTMDASGRVIATSEKSEEGTVCIWECSDSGTWERIETQSHYQGAPKVVLNASGTHLVTGFTERGVRVFEKQGEDWSATATPMHSKGSVNSIASDQASSLLVMGTTHHQAVILKKERKRWTVIQEIPHSAPVENVAINKRGTLVTTVSQTGCAVIHRKIGEVWKEMAVLSGLEGTCATAISEAFIVTASLGAGIGVHTLNLEVEAESSASGLDGLIRERKRGKKRSR